MTRPSLVRADSIDLQDPHAPSAQDHSHAHLGASAPVLSSLAPHQAKTLAGVARETAEEYQRSPRVSWSNGDVVVGGLHSYADDLAAGVARSLGARHDDDTDDTDDEHDQTVVTKHVRNPQRDNPQLDAVGQNGAASSSDDGVVDSDLDVSDEDDPTDRISSSPSIDDEDIDFDFVYALHTFVATVEGQANATKGDTMVLLDDSNSYWWLVRVVKDSSVGYLPAENVETPSERLARYNKHRNIDRSATMLQDQTEKPKASFKGIRRRKKTVTFAAPTFVGFTERAYSSEEDNLEEQFAHQAVIQRQREQQQQQKQQQQQNQQQQQQQQRQQQQKQQHQQHQHQQQQQQHLQKQQHQQQQQQQQQRQQKQQQPQKQAQKQQNGQQIPPQQQQRLEQQQRQQQQQRRAVQPQGKLQTQVNSLNPQLQQQQYQPPQASSANSVNEPSTEEDSAKVEPLRPRPRRDAKISDAVTPEMATKPEVVVTPSEIVASRPDAMSNRPEVVVTGPEAVATRPEVISNRPEAAARPEDTLRLSDEGADVKAETQSRSKNGTVRNTDSFFRDETVETKKINLTPNLLRDDNSPRPSGDARELKQRPSLDRLERDVFTADGKAKDDKKRKDKDKKEINKKSGVIRSLFSRKDKKKTTEEEDTQQSAPITAATVDPASNKQPIDYGGRNDPGDELNASQGPLRSLSKMQSKQNTHIQMSPSGKRSPSAGLGAESQTNELSKLPPSILRVADQEPKAQVRSMVGNTDVAAAKQVPHQGLMLQPVRPPQPQADTPVYIRPATTMVPQAAPVSELPPQQYLDGLHIQGISQLDLDDSDDGHDDSLAKQQEQQDAMSVSLQNSDKPRRTSGQTDLSGKKSLYDSAAHLSINFSLSPAFSGSMFMDPLPVAVDKSSQESQNTKEKAPTPKLDDGLAGDVTTAVVGIDGANNSVTSVATAVAPGPSPATPPSPPVMWNDAKLRAFFDSSSEVRDLLVVVYDKSDVVPPLPADHPIIGPLFQEQNSKLADMSTQLNHMLGDWLGRKQRLQGSL